MLNTEQSLNLHPASVVTVCAGKPFAERLRQAFDCRAWPVQEFDYEAYLSAERRPALNALRSAGGCIAFVDFDTNADEAAVTVQYLMQALPGQLVAVAVSAEHDPATMLTAMRAGCTEFLNREATLTAMLETLDRLESSGAGSAPSNHASGTVLSFFGAKGGVGTTTLAVHVATYLAMNHGKRVLLIDHHAELGHVCVYLGLEGSRFQFQEVVRNVSRLDSELLRGFVVKHVPSGVEVLSAPDVCGGGKVLEAEAIARTLAFLRSEYDYVLLDCEAPSAELNAPVIRASNVVYLVATPDVGAVRDLSRYVDTLVPVEGFGEKLQVIVNRASSTFSIDVAHIERAMKLPVSWRISSSYPELIRAGNLGEPVSPGSKTEIAGQFNKWAMSLAGAPASGPMLKKTRSVLARLQLAKA